MVAEQSSFFNVISCLSTSLSKIFERAGKMETARKSFSPTGGSTLGIGDIRAIFQSDGNVDASIQAFIIYIYYKRLSLLNILRALSVRKVDKGQRISYQPLKTHDKWM